MVRQAAPGGIEEAELYRRTSVLASHIARLKIDSMLYAAFATGQLDVALTDDETDTIWVPSRD